MTSAPWCSPTRRSSSSSRRLRGYGRSVGSPRSAATSRRSRRRSSNAIARTRHARTARCRKRRVRSCSTPVGCRSTRSSSKFSYCWNRDHLRLERSASRRAHPVPADRRVQSQSHRLPDRRSLVCWFTQAFTRMRIEGREHLPTSGAYIVAPVHRSYRRHPDQRRASRRAGSATWASRRSGSTRSIGWLVSALGAFPVNRGHADREALNRCIQHPGDRRTA